MNLICFYTVGFVLNPLLDKVLALNKGEGGTGKCGVFKVLYNFCSLVGGS